MKEDAVKDLFDKMSFIHTPRLVLRRLQPQDARDMYEYASRAEVTEFLLWNEHKSLAYTKEYLRYIESRYSVGDFYDWAVTLKDGGKMIGTCGFAKIDTVNNSAELGYVLNPDHHKKGIAKEAAETVIRFGFESLGLNRIEARFMEGNTPSLRVMEKLGMSFEGFARESVFVKGSYKTVGKCALLSKNFLERE